MGRNNNYIFLLTILALFIPRSESTKILYVFPTGCKSTSGLHHAVSKILIQHGYTILAINSYPLKNTWNFIDISEHINFTIYSDYFTIEDDCVGSFSNLKTNFQGQHQDCEKIYSDEIIKKLMKEVKVDLVLLELDGTDCFLPFVAQTGAPIIGVSTSILMYADFDGLMGNPINPSYIPVTMSGFSTRMNFFQRLSNTMDFLIHWLMNFHFNRKGNIMVAKYMNSPPIQELYDKISLVFHNSHFTMVPKPSAPNSISIAGIHIPRHSSPLPKDIKNFIDDADQGVIYFSLGSVIKVSSFPPRVHDKLLNVLKKLPYRIIWRHDNPEMVANTSENILARYWLPQIDILAHKKVILFMSHSGAFSTYEAIHFAVPLLTFPVLYDQFTNAAIMQDLGIGLSLDLRNLDEDSLLNSINEVIQNKKYRENMNKISKIFADRPQTPEESLLYWVEYVLRHKNTSFLKPAGSKLPFYQYLLIDVILFLFLVSCAMIWIVRVLLKLVYCISDVNKVSVKKSLTLKVD